MGIMSRPVLHSVALSLVRIPFLLLLAAWLFAPVLHASSWVASPPYQLFSFPSMDLTMDGSFYRPMRGLPADSESGYSMLMRGDLAYMSGRLFFSGREGQHPQSARLSLERAHPEGGLWGPFNATRVELGDVNLPYLPFGGGQAERGVLLGNLDLYQGFSFDRTEISGDAPAGWQVELYRNDILLQSQVVGGDGRYQFDDVELYFGENRLRLVFIGPNGERREKLQAFYVGPGQIQPGRFQYQLAMTEQQRSVFELGPDEGEGGYVRSLGRVEYGVSHWLSWGAALQSYRREGKRQLFVDYGLRLTSSNFFSSFDFSRQQGGGINQRLLLHAALDDFKLRVLHSDHSGYASDEEWDLAFDPLLGPSNPLLRRSTLSLDGHLGPLPINMGLERLERAISMERRAQLGISGSLGRLYLYNGFYYSRTQSQGLDEMESLFGSLQWTYAGYPNIFQGRIGYGLKPEQNTEEVFFAVQRILGEGRMLNLELAHYPQIDFSSIALGMYWEMSQLAISPRLSIDDQGGYLAYLYASISLEPPNPRRSAQLHGEAQANYGGLLLKVYLDANRNGRRDPGERPVEGVTVEALEVHSSGASDAEGYLTISRLPAYRLLSLNLDVDMLRAKGLRPAFIYPLVMVRPGRWLELDFAVQEAQ